MYLFRPLLFRRNFAIVLWPLLKYSYEVINAFRDSNIRFDLFFFLLLSNELLIGWWVLHLGISWIFLLGLYNLFQIFASCSLGFVQILFCAKIIKSLNQRLLSSNTLSCLFIFIWCVSLSFISTLCNTIKCFIAWRIDEVSRANTGSVQSLLLALPSFYGSGVH